MKTKNVDEAIESLREQRWSTEDAHRVLAACEASRLSQAAFCREHGLQAKRLSWWRKRLREWGAQRATTNRVRLAPAVVPAVAAPQITIRLPGEVEIEVAEVGASFLAALVSELRELAL